MITPAEALIRLRDGNRRYTDGANDPARHRDLTAGQRPVAAVLGCADARVPVEQVFDQRAGDIFTVRVAGNVASPAMLGSLEYAVTALAVPLIVVLGHTGCGAVAAALAEMQRPTGQLTANLRDIIDRVRPALAPLLHGDLRERPDELAREAVLANVREAVGRLEADSPVIAGAIRDGKLAVTGAEYSLATGRVTFVEPAPGE